MLLPIDDAVIGAFGLAANETGVLVLAVQPGGIAELIGVEPGDVISSVRGYAIADPVELDAVVYYWIGQNQFDFVFDGWLSIPRACGQRFHEHVATDSTACAHPFAKNLRGDLTLPILRPFEGAGERDGKVANAQDQGCFTTTRVGALDA